MKPPTALEIEALARKLHAAGCKAANRKLRAQKDGARMLKWDELLPHVVASHTAVAEYVLRHFDRVKKSTNKRRSA